MVAGVGARKSKGATRKTARDRKAAPAARGSSHSQVSWRDKLNNYFQIHRQVARDSAMRMRRAPASTLVTWLVIAVAIILPASLAIFAGNVQKLGESWDGHPRMSVFMEMSATEQMAKRLQKKVQKQSQVEQVDYVSPGRALKQFEQRTGFGDILADLSENPFPAVLVVMPHLSASAKEQNDLAVYLKGQPGVEQVQYDLAWVQRLQLLIAIGEYLVLGLAILCGTGALLVVGNTIRLGVESRRQEIVVVKLVGGTNAFVRRPFLYLGVGYGLGGGLLAVVTLLICIAILDDKVSQLAALYQSQYTLQGLTLGDALGLLTSATFLGWLGAWLAVGHQLDNIEPG